MTRSRLHARAKAAHNRFLASGDQMQRLLRAEVVAKHLDRVLVRLERVEAENAQLRRARDAMLSLNLGLLQAVDRWKRA